MSLSTQLPAYTDCEELFDRAIADEKGIRVCYQTENQAKLAQMRLHQFRKLLREQSKRLFDKGDPRWGMSEYDKLVVRSPQVDTDGEWWIYIEHIGLAAAAVENLSELEP